MNQNWNIWEKRKVCKEIDPANSDVYHHRGQVKLLTENTAEAVKDFEKSVELNPTFPIAYVQKLYTEYRAAQEAQDTGT